MGDLTLSLEALSYNTNSLNSLSLHVNASLRCATPSDHNDAEPPTSCGENDYLGFITASELAHNLGLSFIISFAISATNLRACLSFFCNSPDITFLNEEIFDFGTVHLDHTFCANPFEVHN